MEDTALAPADADRLLDSLRRMGLAEPDEVVAFTPLTGGVSSQIVRADARRGVLCVKRALPQLKVAATWHAPVERNTAEVAWLRLAGRLIPGAVPKVLGEDPAHGIFAMEFLPPSRHENWKQQLREGRARPETARALGRNLLAVHQATANDGAMASAFAHDSSFHALRLEPYFEATARVHADCSDALMALSRHTAQTRRALVHGDVSPKNILVSADGPVLLDAECAWYGDPAFDLAFCLNHLLLKCVWVPGFCPLYLDSFDTFCAAYLDGVNWEPRAELERRSAHLLAALLLARVDGKSPVEYLTAPADRDRVRQFAKRWVLHPADSLSPIRSQWEKEMQ